MKLTVLIFLRSFNSDYIVSEVVIDRILNCKLAPQKVSLGYGRKREREKERERAERRLLAVNVYRAMLLDHNFTWDFTVSYEIASLFSFRGYLAGRVQALYYFHGEFFLVVVIIFPARFDCEVGSCARQ